MQGQGQYCRCLMGCGLCTLAMAPPPGPATWGLLPAPLVFEDARINTVPGNEDYSTREQITLTLTNLNSLWIEVKPQR